MSVSLLCKLSDNQPLCEENDYHWAETPYEILLSELKMLLISRVRTPNINEIPLVNASILNYGIDESYIKINDNNSRRMIIEQYLKNTITRFEPRLSQVTLTSNSDDPQIIHFILHGVYFCTEVIIELTWNDCTGRFYFNE